MDVEDGSHVIYMDVVLLVFPSKAQNSMGDCNKRNKKQQRRDKGKYYNHFFVLTMFSVFSSAIMNREKAYACSNAGLCRGICTHHYDSRGGKIATQRLASLDILFCDLHSVLQSRNI